MSLQDSPYFEINGEVWQLLKNHIPVSSSADFWDEVLESGKQIVDKYADAPQAKYCKDLVFATINELDRLAKAGDTKGKN